MEREFFRKQIERMSSVEYMLAKKDFKEDLLKYLTHAQKDACMTAVLITTEEGYEYVIGVNSDGRIYVYAKEADCKADNWFARYSSIDTYMLHCNISIKQKEKTASHADCFLDAFCNFDDPKEFYLDEVDCTGHRPAPFGPEDGREIIVCTSKQIQEIRRRVNAGELFSNDMILEIRPIAIYKTFEDYCKTHSSATILAAELEIQTEDGSWILNPDRPKWITPEDALKASILALYTAETEEVKKAFPYITEEELKWIDDGDDEKFVEKRGLGYFNYCKRHNIPFPEYMFGEIEKMHENVLEEKERKIQEALKELPSTPDETITTLGSGFEFKKGEDMSKMDPRLRRMYAEEMMRRKRIEESQKHFEDSMKQAWKRIEDTEKGFAKPFCWARDVLDTETLEMYREDKGEIEPWRKKGIKNRMAEIEELYGKDRGKNA